MKRLSSLIASIMLIGLALSLSAADDVNILVIGSSHSFSEGGESGVVHEKPFNPTVIATELQSILSNDPAITGTVNVQFEDIYKTKTISTAVGSPQSYLDFTYHCYSLTQYFMWPEGKTDRMTNLRGAGTTAWDYVILMEDPYVLANFPGMYAEGVKLIQSEVSQGTAQLVLLSQWPENSAGFTATQFNEIVYRVGDPAGLAVVPAGKAWDTLDPQDTSINHPTPKGEYLAAASIYSRLYDRNASSSDYTNDDTIADHALTVVQANAGVSQYSGIYTTPNPFQMKYVRKRHLDYSERGTSTEDGIINGLNDVFSVCRMTSTKFNVATHVDFHFSRGTDIFEADKQYLVDPALYDRSYGFPMQDHGDTGLETMVYGIDKRYQGTAFRNGTDLGVAYSMILEGEVEPTYDVKNIPMRLLWSKMYHENPTLVFAYRNPATDLWHISDEMERATAAFLFTLNTGRCPIEDEPADNTTTEWQRWYGKKIGYETAWQMSHLTTRAPGFQVLPSAATANKVTPGSSETLSVKFHNTPTSNVTVNITVDDPSAGTVTPSTLTFTPGNHDTPQTVTVSAAAGTESGSFPFNVNLATTSDDVVYNGVADVWDFENERKFAQLSKTAATVAEDGGTDTFTVVLNWQPDSDVVLDLSSSDTGEATVSPATLTFTNSGWDTPQTVTITGVNDNTLATDTATIIISVNDAASDDAFDGQPDQTVDVTCTNDDSAGFTLSKTTSTVDENGGTDTFTVTLDARPTTDVVIDLISSDPGEATVSPSGLAFSTGNWDTPQTVTITGINDFAMVDDTATITASINADSSDDDFDALPSQNVTVTCTDDEVLGSEGTNSPPVVAPIPDQTINLGDVDPEAPVSEVELVGEVFGGSNAVNLAGTTAETFDAALISSGGSGTWGGSTNIKADGYGRANSAKITYLTLGSYINDAKGEADAKFELTATLSQPIEGSGYNFISFSNAPTPAAASNATFVASIGYAQNGTIVTSKGPGLGTLESAGTFSGDRTLTIELDFTPTFYNGSTTFGRITWSDSVAGIFGTSDLTSDISFQSIILVLDGTMTGSRTTNYFSDLTLKQSAASSSASTTLSSSVSDPDNNPLTLNWSVVSSPDGSVVTFGDTSSQETGATFSALGTYTLRLTATDNWGASDSEDFTVTVVSADTNLISVEATDAEASESGSDVGVWTITRTGNTDAGLNVLFSMSGSGTLTDDYTLSSTSPVTIPAGESSVTVTLTPVDDSDVESDESVVLTITEDAAYVITTASDTISIADNDVSGFALTVNNGTGSGNYAEGANVAISATVPNGEHFVNWTGDTGALADPNSASTTVTMPASTVSVTANFGAGDTPHSADIDNDWSISQTEVNNFITAYGNNSNTATTANGDITADRITMREVMRVIYLYNNGGLYIYVGKPTTVDGYDIEVAPAAAPETPDTPEIGDEGDGSLVVTSTADSGVGSLRDAIAIVTDGETITIDDSLGTITLLDEIVIDKSITIDGQGVAIVSGDKQTRIFRVENADRDIDVTIKNIGIVDAENNSDEFGGAVYNNGQALTLDTVLFDGNANTAANQDGVQYGKGGAVYSSGTLNIENCEFRNNTASEENDVYSE